MSVAARQPLPPELEALEVDKRSVLAFRHGFPSELVRWHCHDDYELHYIAASVGKVFVGDHVGAFASPNPKESEHWFNRMIEADDAARIPLLLDFLLRLSSETEYRLLSTMPIRAEADSAALDKVDRVTSYVSDHYASDIPLATVAALVGMSESTFSRFFTKETGNGFTRFLNRVRVAKACELLGDSEVPITDICFAVGFNNVANFNRRFRELKAVTPREYRQQTRLRHNATRPAHTLG